MFAYINENYKHYVPPSQIFMARNCYLQA